jgi:hypothetical protein
MIKKHKKLLGWMPQNMQILIDLYGNTVIKLFLKMPNFLEIICLKCQNARKLEGRGKKKGEIPLANPPLHIMYVIIDNIFLSYNMLEHYVSPFLQMETIKNVVKHFIMLEL